MSDLPKEDYKTEEELKILKKIKKAREEGDEWFRKYYLKELQLVGTGGNKFRVYEIKEKDLRRMDEGVRNFLPYACRKCGYEGEIKRRLFKMDIPPTNQKEWKELKKYMEKKYKIKYFRVRRGIGVNILMAATCPRCESQEILFDYIPPRLQKKERRRRYDTNLFPLM